MNPIPTLNSFESLTLGELDEKANMLTRVDNKYILTEPLTAQSICNLESEFDVLDVNNRRTFGYQNIYFDDAKVCFNEHRKGKRKKFKARTRLYLDSEELAYFEVKLTGKGRIIDKYRIPCSVSEHGSLPDHFIAFIKMTYLKKYGKEFEYQLTPSVETSYRRITLVAKKGGERLTIDYDLSLSLNGIFTAVPPSLSIFETKSKNGNGIADKILRAASIPRVKGCSKFCLSMALSGQVSRYNKFLPIIRKHFNDKGIAAKNASKQQTYSAEEEAYFSDGEPIRVLHQAATDTRVA